MVKKLIEKFTSKYSFAKNLEDSLGFVKKHELKNVIVYDREDYELIVCSPAGLESAEYVVLTCNNEHIFEINFIPRSEIFAEILIKSAIKEYEKKIENDNSVVWTPANR